MRNTVSGKRLAARRTKDAIAQVSQQRREDQRFRVFLHGLIGSSATSARRGSSATYG